MRRSTKVRTSISGNVLLIGGCYGAYFFLYAADEATGRTIRRQFLLAHCVVLTLCMTIVALVVAVAVIVTALDGS